MSEVRILDARGQPMQPAPKRAQMLAGANVGYGTPYDAANVTDERSAAWRPYLWSADAQLNIYRDRIVARARDLARNDGWASGAVTRLLDNAIGAAFRPISKPDHRALAAYTGIDAFDDEWAEEFGRAVDAHWRAWADDEIGKYCDVERKSWMGLMFGVAFRHLLIDNDALAVLQERPERVGLGGARYDVCVQLVDPDRLSNPQNAFDMRHMRGGVEIDADGAAIAYHVRKAHQGDWWAAADAVTWQRIPRETADGQPLVVHYWEQGQAGEHRGGAGIFTPVLNRMRMLLKYDDAELDAAIINAYMAAVAESPFDHELLGEALGEGDVRGLLAYQDSRREFHDEARLMVNGAKVIKLYPGEKLSMVHSERPNPNFAAFQGAFLRNVAQATGGSSTQISGNWAEMNYSSARAELGEVWKTTIRRRHNFAGGFAQPIRCAFMAESFLVDDLPLPAGAPDFLECRAAYARARWMGPGRGVIDSVQERKGSVLGMDAGLTHLEAEAAESSGENWEDILDQRKREVAGFLRRGLQPPSWSAMNPQAEQAHQTIANPEPA